jgi:hypothetical protein
MAGSKRVLSGYKHGQDTKARLEDMSVTFMCWRKFQRRSRTARIYIFERRE